MHFVRGSMIVVALITLFLFISIASFAEPSSPSTPRRHSLAQFTVRTDSDIRRVIAGEIIVRFKRDRSRNRMMSSMRRHGGERVGENRRTGASKIRVPAGSTIEELLARYAADPDVECVEPNHAATLQGVTSDEQWNLRAVHAEEAWNIEPGGAEVTVAVLDSGLDTDHPALAGKWGAGVDLVNGDADPSDDNGHGTEVAGIIAAAGGIGVSGAAPGCRILPIKVCDAAGVASYSDICDAIVAAADSGARVINISLGGSASSLFLQNAVDYAVAKGCVIVAAGGNNGISAPVYPAACRGVLGVASIDPNLEHSSFSNRGPHIDLAAPGRDIASLANGGGVVRGLSGTSFAAPLVSSCAALLVSRSPQLTADDIAALICNSANDLGETGRDDLYGHGLVDFLAALRSVDTSVSPEFKERPAAFHSTARPLTDAEFARILAAEGTSIEGENYNRVFGSGPNARGTGMRPPTITEWNAARLDILACGEPTLLSEAGRVMSAPDTWDNSTTRWFPPVGNQGVEGTCASWVTAYYIKTFHEAKEHDWDLSSATWDGYPSHAHWEKIMSPDFLYHLINGGVDNGSNYGDNVDVVKTHGASTWENMPYDASVSTTWPPEMAWREAPLYRGLSGLLFLTTNSDDGLENLKSLIASGNLAMLLVNADSYPQMSSDSDLWTKSNYAPSSYNHGNTIVGYDNNFGPFIENGSETRGAFKVVNQWGKGGWPGGGDTNADGFFWISYNALKSYPGYVYYYTDSVGYAPQLLARIQMSHPKRGECRMRIGVGDTTAPTAVKQFLPLTTKVDANPFSSGVFVVDITELKQTVPPDSFFLQVFDTSSSASVGSITAFGVETYGAYDRNGNADSVFMSAQVPQATVDGETRGVAVLTTTNLKEYSRWYVNDTSTIGDSWTTAIGDNANGGNSPAAPKRTIAAVMPFLTPGDTVFIDAGLFFETVILSLDGVSLIGVDSTSTVLDAGDSSATNARVGIRVEASGGNLLRDLRVTNACYGVRGINVRSSLFERLGLDRNRTGIQLQDGSNFNTVTAIAATRNATNGIALENTHHNLVTGCIATFNDDGIMISNDYYDTIFSCTSVSNLDKGMQFTSSPESCLITGNLFGGNGDDGMYCNAGMSNCVISHNAFTGNGDYGLYFSTGCNNSIFSGNTSTMNADDGYYFWGTHTGCTYAGNTSANNQGEGFLVRGDFVNCIFYSNLSANNFNHGFYIFSGAKENKFYYNTSVNNRDNGFYIVINDSQVLVGNTIMNNDDYQIRIGNLNYAYIHKNNIRASDTNPTFGFYSSAFAVQDISRNWWSTADSAAVRALMQGTQGVTWAPFRLGEIDTAIGGDTIAPSAPSALFIRDTSPQTASCTVAWAAPSTNEEYGGAPTDLAGYRIFRGTSPAADSPGTLVGVAGAADTTFRDSAIPLHTYVYYCVSSHDSHASLPNQSWYSAKIRTYLNQPPIPQSNDDSTIKITDSFFADGRTSYDTDGPGSLSYAWSASDTRVHFSHAADSISSVGFDSPGYYSITLSVTDGFDTVTRSFAANVLSTLVGDLTSASGSASKIDVEDWQILFAEIRARWNAAPANPGCDLDGDGRMTFQDLIIFAKQYGLSQ